MFPPYYDGKINHNQRKDVQTEAQTVRAPSQKKPKVPDKEDKYVVRLQVLLVNGTFNKIENKMGLS